MTPQIDRLIKMSTVLRVSTHIYGVFAEIDGKTFIFRVNLGMWPVKLIVLEERALFWGFLHRFIGFWRRKVGKCSFLEYTYACDPSNRLCWKNKHCSEGFNNIYGVCKEIDGKTFIFRVNLHMWPLKSIILEKWALFWGFQHTFMVFPRT